MSGSDWDPIKRRHFSYSKKKTDNGPNPQYPPGRRDDLDTDASDVGLGAVLSQEQNGQVVFAYASKTLSRTQHIYDVTRRELLAVVYGLKTYRQYLLGRHFVIRTDHSALQSLRRTAEPIGQQA